MEFRVDHDLEDAALQDCCVAGDEGSGETDRGADRNAFGHFVRHASQAEDGDEYVVVQPPVGATVPYVPDDAEKKTVNEVEYYVYSGIYYQAKSSNGDVVYEVVEHP